MKAILFQINGEMETVIPLKENLEKSGVETFEELKSLWTAQKWGFTNNVEKMELTSIKNCKAIVSCDEFEIALFKKYALKVPLYDRPHDKKPRTAYFLNGFAFDCYIGQIYSKDFKYFVCDCCGRMICEQNPANGWHVQYRMDDDATIMECLKCYEENLYENGVDVEKLKAGVIPGMFLNRGDAKEHGFKEEKSYFVDSRNVKSVTQDILSFLPKKILIEYDRLSYCGSEGTITVHTK